jgi:hypothetical protein
VPGGLAAGDGGMHAIAGSVFTASMFSRVFRVAPRRILSFACEPGTVETIPKKNPAKRVS